MPINNGRTIGDAASGADSSIDGTEKVPVSGNKYALISSIAEYIRTLTQTLTNKTISLASNTLTGTTAQFNTALSDGDFATLAGTETLTNKTLTSPTINTATIATPTITAPSLSTTVALTGDISPSQITSNQNDYNPTGLSTASILRLSTDASRNITGLQGGADGRLIIVVNVGSNNIVLKDDDANSSAANRFALSGDITLSADDGVTLEYDSTSSRWRCIGKSPSGAGTGDVVGPASSTDEAIARFDGTTGKLLQNSSITISDTGAMTFPDNVRQTFNPGADAAGINVGSIAGDPGTPSNGDMWYDSTANELTARINGANVALGAGGGGSVATDSIWDAKGDLAVGTGANTAARLAVGSDGKTVVADNSQSTGIKWVTGVRELISSQTPSGTGTVTFSSIPGTFTQLELVYIGRGTTASTSIAATIRFNSDSTAANYRRIQHYGYLASTTGADGADNNDFPNFPGSSSPSGSAAGGTIWIPFYKGTTFNKQAFGVSAARRDASATFGEIIINYGIEWESTSAITQIDIILASGNYESGSTFNLYGWY